MLKQTFQILQEVCFSDAWRSYLDEVYMVARHVNENRIKTLNKRELAKMKISARKKQQDNKG